MPITQLFGTVIRHNPDGSKSRFEVTKHAEAEYLHNLQQFGYTYTVIHNVSRECDSCHA